MQDRVPTFPGRVRLDPIIGQENVYDLTRADEPTQEGTPLNKNTFLTDAVAAAIGLVGNPTVSDALNKLQININDIADVAIGSYIGTGTYNVNNPTSVTFPFIPTICIKLCATYGTPLRLQSTLLGANTNGVIFPWSILTTSYKNNGAWGQSCYSRKNGKTIQWYSDSSAYAQQNDSGYTFYWLAIKINS